MGTLCVPMGTYGDLWGPMGTLVDLRGPMGSFGDLWGHTRTYGDVWGPMGPFSGLVFFQLFHIGLIFPNPLILYIFFLDGGASTFCAPILTPTPPPLPPSIIPTSEISHILLYTLQTQHATSDFGHQTLCTILPGNPFQSKKDALTALIALPEGGKIHTGYGANTYLPNMPDPPDAYHPLAPLVFILRDMYRVAGISTRIPTHGSRVLWSPGWCRMVGVRVVRGPVNLSSSRVPFCSGTGASRQKGV